MSCTQCSAATRSCTLSIRCSATSRTTPPKCKSSSVVVRRKNPPDSRIRMLWKPPTFYEFTRWLLPTTFSPQDILSIRFVLNHDLHYFWRKNFWMLFNFLIAIMVLLHLPLEDWLILQICIPLVSGFIPLVLPCRMKSIYSECPNSKRPVLGNWTKNGSVFSMFRFQMLGSFGLKS